MYVQGGSKNKLLFVSEYVDKTEQIRTITEKNKALSDILYVKYFTSQCLNILWLKADNNITARQARTGLCKHDVIKACSMEYLTTLIELVLPTFFQLLDRSQNYRIFNVRAMF